MKTTRDEAGTNTVLIYTAASPMSLTQLRYFVAVAEEGSVSAAAARCHVSQPPMSRQLRALEDELQVQLFERLPRGMRLSPQGETVLERARRILSMVDALVAKPAS